VTNTEQLGAVEVRGITRQSFLLGGAIAAGATCGLEAVAPFVSGALADSAASDIDVLSFLLTVEYLETNFYLVKAKTLPLTGAVATHASRFGHQEARHVEALRMAIVGLGGRPAAIPSFSFPATTEATFLALAYTLENLGVAAYNGALPTVQSTTIVATVASIVQVEARHAATIGVLASRAVTPDGAFDKPVTRSQALAATGTFTAG
jgi:hypothetical protein